MRDKKDYIKKVFAEISKRHPEVIFFDPKDIQCDEGLCRTAIHDLPFYDDGHHITNYASRWLAEQLIEENANPLKGNR